MQQDISLAQVRAELKSEISETGRKLAEHRFETATGFSEVRKDVAEMRKDFENHRAETKAEFAGIHEEFAGVNARLSVHEVILWAIVDHLGIRDKVESLISQSSTE